MRRRRACSIGCDLADSRRDVGRAVSRAKRTTIIVAALVACLCARAKPAASTQPSAQTVRVAVIGGMNETGFWDAIAQRFENETGIHVDTVATGPKDGISAVFKRGGVDLITMHSSDVMMNLCADGYAMDPQPWAKNDMVIVGPIADSAHIKGMTDAAAAMKKIVATKSRFIVHSSLGAQEVLEGILSASEIALDESVTKILLDDHQRRVLKIAQDEQAYTLIGRIPFLSGKIPSEEMAAMVAGDERLKRPFVVAVANPERVTGARVELARKLVAFLRSSANQEWIATFGKGKYDDHPLFFPVVVGK